MSIAVKGLLKPVLNRISNLLPNLGSSLSIGLDLGPDRLNLVQMKLVAGKPRICAIASMPYLCSREELLKNPKKLKALLKQAYAKQPFKGKRVVSHLPVDQLKIVTISYKKTEGQPDAVAVATELRERFQGDIDSMVVDFMPLRQEEADTGKRDALVAIAPREKVLTYLDLLTEAGLEVDALDIGPSALARLVSHVGAIESTDFQKTPNLLLINFGADNSFLTIIWGRRLMLDRTVEFSENRLFTKLQQALEMPESLVMRLLYKKTAVTAEETHAAETSQMLEEILLPEVTLLLQEVNKTLVYMASRTRGKSVDKIYLAGRVARYPSILNFLNDALHIPVCVLNPVTIFSDESFLTREAFNDKEFGAEDLGTLAGIALTTGLALRGVPENG